MARGEYARAALCYSQAIWQSPSDPSLLSNRSFAFLRLSLPARAVSDADRAISLSPGWAKAHFRRAEGLSQAGLHTDALKAYAHASSLDPSDSHLRERCERERRHLARSKRREVMVGVAGGMVGMGLMILLLYLREAQPSPTKGKPAPVGGHLMAASGVVVGTLLGLAGGGLAVLLRRQQRKGAVLPPLKTNDQFAAEQMKASGFSVLESAPVAPVDDKPPVSTIPGGKPKEGTKGVARRNTGNGRAAALKALGKHSAKQM